LRRISTFISAALLACPTLAQQPLSAIEWLNEPISVPVANPLVPPIDEPPVTDGIVVHDVTVMPLEAAGHDAVGLLPTSVTGLPPSLWSASDERDLLLLWNRASAEPIPAVQALYYTLLLAEADAPLGADGAFLIARVDSLERFGAVEPAQALLERAGPNTPDLFAQWFDLTLLSGDEGKACNALKLNPSLHPGYAAQIFCTARSGDWNTAVLLFDTAQALDVLNASEKHLLAQFLQPETAETATQLAPVKDPSPLIFRLYEAIGTPLPTRNLPLAFATADLRDTSGWKVEIEAAERLVRTGALSENRLLGLYTDRKPAASGGLWDRLKDFQKFETALGARDATRVALTLPDVWQHMRQQRLEIAFARLFSEALTGLSLPASSKSLAFKIAMLTADYEASATNAGDSRSDRFLASLAIGEPDSIFASSPLEHAIADTFSAAIKPALQDARLLRNGRLGEAILSAANRLDLADVGDLPEISSALATLRAVGLEDTARRAALQLVILDRVQ